MIESALSRMSILFLNLFSMCTLRNEIIYTKLSPNIYQFNNQYFYWEKVHTYLIELEDKILLFDIPTYSKASEDFILSFKKSVYAILSHGSCGISDGEKWQKLLGVKIYAHEADRNHPWLKVRPDIFFSKAPYFGKIVEVIHTPGHSPGAVCILEKTSKSLLTGDTLYGNENGLVKDFLGEKTATYEDPMLRIESCKKLMKYDFENIYPFHYKKIISGARIKLMHYLYTINNDKNEKTHRFGY